MNNRRLLPLTAALVGGLIAPAIVAGLLRSSGELRLKNVALSLQVLTPLVVGLAIFVWKAARLRSRRPFVEGGCGILAGFLSGLMLGGGLRMGDAPGSSGSRAGTSLHSGRHAVDHHGRRGVRCGLRLAFHSNAAMVPGHSLGQRHQIRRSFAGPILVSILRDGARRSQECAPPCRHWRGDEYRLDAVDRLRAGHGDFAGTI